MASQPPRGKPPKRFRAAAALLRGDAPPPQPTASSVLDRDLGDAAARLLRREAEAAPPPPASGDEFPTAMAERSGGKVALHNGRFLRREVWGPMACHLKSSSRKVPYVGSSSIG